MDERTVRLIVADDSLPARHGLCAILAGRAGIEIIGEASQGVEALALVEEKQPEAALLDVRMRAMDGVQATRLIKRHWPATRVILISMFADHEGEALAAGADAFVVKGCPVEELLTAILNEPPKEETGSKE